MLDSCPCVARARMTGLNSRFRGNDGKGADVSIQNDLGETPLHIAIAEHGEDSRMVRLLRANESTWQMIKRWLFGD